MIVEELLPICMFDMMDVSLDIMLADHNNGTINEKLARILITFNRTNETTERAT